MTRKTSPALAAYRRLVKEKSKMCKGQTTSTKVKAAAKAYVTATVKAGTKTTAEAQKAAAKVVRRGCSVAAKKAAVKRTTKTTAASRRRAA